MIEVTHRFNVSVSVTGDISTTLLIGEEPRVAHYSSGSGTNSLKFHYVVVDEDLDLDGIHLPAADSQNRRISGNGSITDAATGAALVPADHSIVNAPGHKVGPVPYVTDIEVFATDEESTRLTGETMTLRSHHAVHLQMTYNTPVTVAAGTYFEIHIGPNEGEGHDEGYRQARFVGYADDDPTRPQFAYYVTEGLSDTDGISVMSGHLGGDIAAVSGGRLAGSYQFTEWRAMTEFEVDAAPTPHAISFKVVSEPQHPTRGSGPDNAYNIGDEIAIEVTFSEPIVSAPGHLPGDALLRFRLGDNERIASNRHSLRPDDTADGTGSTEVFFYTVRADDLDSDGISIDAVSEDDIYDAERFSARSIGFNAHIASTDVGIYVSAVHDGMPAQSGHRVGYIRPDLAGIDVTGFPKDGDDPLAFYERDETIGITVTYNVPVTVAADADPVPSFVIEIGSPNAPSLNLREAEYVRGSGTASLVFEYVVTAQDEDRDGITLIGGPWHALGDIYAVAGGVNSREGRSVHLSSEDFNPSPGFRVFGNIARQFGGV